MWPHQSGLREILRCVCYEKMEGSRASCAASRGAFGFLCSQTSRNAGLWRLTPATTSQTSPPPLPRQGHGSEPPAETPTGSHRFWGRRAQMCWVTALPRNEAAPLPRRPADVPAPASRPRMPSITCGKLSPTISFAYASLCQTPRKELILSAAVCLEQIKRL